MFKWIRNQSLWLVGLGLMLASSGIDGEYMSTWMPGDAAWLGYVLNTVSDVCGMVLTYWWGRLRQFPSNSKRYKLAMVLLPAEIVTVSYSWFFSWRQLRLILPRIEGIDAPWVAPIAAGFIPLLLAFVGYAQSLLAGRIDAESTRNAATIAAQRRGSDAAVTQGAVSAASVSLQKADFDAWFASFNGNAASVQRKDVLAWAQSRGADVSTAAGKQQRDKVLRWLRQMQRKVKAPQ